MNDPLTADEIAELREWVKLALGRSWTGDEAKLAFAFRHRIPRLLDEVERWRNPDHVRMWRDQNGADLERARALLKRIEWNSIDQGEGRCPECQGSEPTRFALQSPPGHRPGCELAALLAP